MTKEDNKWKVVQLIEDNFNLKVGDLMQKYADQQTKELTEEVERLKTHCIVLSKGYDNEITQLKAETKEKDEMIDALIDELEGTTKTDHTFRLIEKARKLIFLKHRK